MRLRSSLTFVVIVGALLAAGWGGGAKVAWASTVRCPGHVRSSSNANGVLWVRGGSKPVVYAVSGSRVIGPGGASKVPARDAGVGFWACSPHSLLYMTNEGVLRMSGAHGPTTIGANGVAAPNGWFLTFNGSTISYTNGVQLVAQGVPDGFEITTVAVDPRNPRIVFASTDSPEQEIEHCKSVVAAAYRVTPTQTSNVFHWTPCHGDPLIAWSPDGTHMSFIQGGRKFLYIADPYGRAAVPLVPNVSTYLWSPDGSRIAYEVANTRKAEVAVVDVATGATRVVAAGTLGAWSPAGKDVAVISGSHLLSVPAAGGRAHTLASFR